MLVVLVALVAVSGCLATPPDSPVSAPRRIACVGDSLTSGFQMEHPERDAYPAQLARRLGAAADVRAFAVPGRTALKGAALSLWKESVFTNALAWQPEVVILCLGANDSFPPIWKQEGAAFEGDLKAMVARFAALPSHPRIWLALPTPMFLEEGNIQLGILADGVRPAVRRVAEATGSGLIDWYAPLRDKRDAFMPDKVHPLPAAAERMAEAAWQALQDTEGVDNKNKRR
jgi:lysophospholipase L1-like esterase